MRADIIIFMINHNAWLWILYKQFFKPYDLGTKFSRSCGVGEFFLKGKADCQKKKVQTTRVMKMAMQTFL